MLNLNEAETEMAAGRLNASTLTARCLDAIERRDGDLHAFIGTNPDAAADATTADQAGSPTGVLHGMPVAIKDNIETAGSMPTTAGSLALTGNVTGRDAPLVTALRAAGAIIIGKTNLSEWANFRARMSSSGWSAVGGQTRNPHDTARSPCGSSSGSAVAVAAGLVPAAIGTETNGSVVCPAAVNGIVGIKPSVGLVSASGIVPISHTQDTAGPMARTVADAARLLGAMCGQTFDPGTAAPEHLRLGVVRSLTGFHPQVDALFDATLDTLRAAGVTLVDGLALTAPSGFRRAMLTVMLYEFRANLNTYLATLPDNGQPRTLTDVIAFNHANAAAELVHFGQDLLEQANAKGPLSEPEYTHALALLRRATRDEGIDAALSGASVDALVAPTNSPAWMIDHINGDHSLGSAAAWPAIAGYPHVTLPMGAVRGLPVGLSLFARGNDDAQLIATAASIERLLPLPPAASWAGASQ